MALAADDLLTLRAVCIAIGLVGSDDSVVLIDEDERVGMGVDDTLLFKSSTLGWAHCLILFSCAT